MGTTLWLLAVVLAAMWKGILAADLASGRDRRSAPAY